MDLWLLHKIWCSKDRLTNCVARTLKNVRISKGDYWIKQWFSSFASLFKMGTSLKGKNLFPEGANSFLWEHYRMIWNITFTTLGDLPCYYFIRHVRKGHNGSYANADSGQLSEGSFLMMQLPCFMYLSQQGVHYDICSKLLHMVISIFVFTFSTTYICHFSIFNDMGLDARKPLFGGFRTTKAQTSLHILAVWSAPLLFSKWKVSYLDWLPAKFQIFQLVSVAEQAGLKLTLSETLKTGFLRRGPYNIVLTWEASILRRFQCQGTTTYIFA